MANTKGRDGSKKEKLVNKKKKEEDLFGDSDGLPGRNINKCNFILVTTKSSVI